MNLNVGTYVLGSLSSSRTLVNHAGLLSAYADGVMADKGEVREAYLSHFAFGLDLKKHHTAHRGSVAGFAGACWSKYVVLDIDRDCPEEALADVRRLVAYLQRRYPEIEGRVIVFFSGSKGYHVLLELSHRPQPAVGFHRTVRSLAEGLAGQAGVRIDTSIYDLAHIIRLPNTRHPKTGLYKRRIETDALFALTMQGIREIAKGPAGDGMPDAGTCPQQLPDDWRQAEARASGSLQTKIASRREPDTDLRAPRWFLEFFRFGVQVGERRPTLFRSAAWLTEQGAPPSLVKALLWEVACDQAIAPADVSRQIACGVEHANRQRAEVHSQSQTDDHALIHSDTPNADLSDAFVLPLDQAPIKQAGALAVVHGKAAGNLKCGHQKLPYPDPPPHAEIIVADGLGRTPAKHGEEFMWCWTGGPGWYFVKEHPLPKGTR
ncbi:MAG: hypothetical protein U0744_04580 [Gemmataceae bacterium]